MGERGNGKRLVICGGRMRISAGRRPSLLASIPPHVPPPEPERLLVGDVHSRRFLRPTRDFDAMKTAPKADALEKLARSLKQLDDRIQVYLLPSDPEGPSQDNDLHVAVLADVDDNRLVELDDAIADVVQDINGELDYDPFVVVHPTNRDDMLARSARQSGVRL